MCLACNFTQQYKEQNHYWDDPVVNTSSPKCKSHVSTVSIVCAYIIHLITAVHDLRVILLQHRV